MTEVLTTLYVLPSCMDGARDGQDEKPEERGHPSGQIGSMPGVIFNGGVKL